MLMHSRECLCEWVNNHPQSNPSQSWFSEILHISHLISENVYLEANFSNIVF